MNQSDMQLEDFYAYFLDGQREGAEVYIGERVAMVVYPEEERVGFSSIGDISGIFASVKDLESIEEFRRVRKPRNLEGIKPEITKDLKSLLQITGAIVENEDCIAMIAYNEGMFNQRTKNYCPLVTKLYLDESDGYYADAVENYLEDVAK